ncbi:MAG: hypothetical protein AB1483_09550 [Candidatus Zixiibacteriota bacterium]
MHIPQLFEFSIGGYFGPSYEFSLKSGELHYRTFADHFEPKAQAVIKLSGEEWRSFREAIDKLNIWDWQTRYEIPALDGTSWALKLEYADRSINSSGCNAYPGDPPEVSAGDEGSMRFNSFLKEVHMLLRSLDFAEAGSFDENRFDEE